MKSLKNTLLLLAIFTFLCSNLAAAVAYEVTFQGINSPEIQSLLRATSRLVSLADNPPETAVALKRRAEADVANLIGALHGLAYYAAKVEVEVQNKIEPARVVFHIDPGPVYTISDFQLIPDSDPHPVENIPLKDLGITLESPAFSSHILEAEDLLIQTLAKRGYPLAKIQKREVIADQKSKTISVKLYVESGPQGIFGKTTISGHTDVSEDFFQRKIGWQTGSVFDPEAIERTQEALEASGLFNSVVISYPEMPDPDGSLPMSIQVAEAKHRTIGAGIGYATSLGPGLSLEWDHRNFRGTGDKIRFRSTMWQETQQASLAYIMSDFGKLDQDLIWLADIAHESTKGYTDTSVSFSGMIDRKIDENTRFSYGGQYRYISSTRSDNDGVFMLLKTPMQLRWSNADNLLDPTFGKTLNFKIAPALQLLSPQFAYCTSTLTGTFYQPLTSDNRLILAGKATLGSIIGASRHTLPPSERFYAGNENTLRGYRYMTVSPLGRDHKPIGGRSIMVYSLEARYRLTEKFGLVGFYEIGNVYSSPMPQLSQKQLQSTGVGLRYHTPVGPIRLDFAVPLNKRKHVDNDYQIYFSIGQSF